MSVGINKWLWQFDLSIALWVAVVIAALVFLTGWIPALTKRRQTQ